MLANVQFTEFVDFVKQFWVRQSGKIAADSHFLRLVQL